LQKYNLENKNKTKSTDAKLFTSIPFLEVMWLSATCQFWGNFEALLTFI